MAGNCTKYVYILTCLSSKDDATQSVDLNPILLFFIVFFLGKHLSTNDRNTNALRRIHSHVRIVCEWGGVLSSFCLRCDHLEIVHNKRMAGPRIYAQSFVCTLALIHIYICGVKLHSHIVQLPPTGSGSAETARRQRLELIVRRTYAKSVKCRRSNMNKETDLQIMFCYGTQVSCEMTKLKPRKSTNI